MHLARVMTEHGPRYGAVDPKERSVRILTDECFPPGPSPQFTGVSVPLDGARLLAPVAPGKVVVIGRNYGSRADAADTLVLHLKPPTAVTGPGEPILLPSGSKDVRYEGELAVVIGSVCRAVDPDQAEAHVFGYTCANDVTAWDIGTEGGQWTKAKGMDTFCPLGPWITTDVDPAAAVITTHVNGELRQHGSTAELTRATAVLVSEVSHLMTLLPGDVLLTGTPGGSASLADGDEVTVAIEGIGALRNPVAGR
ncbi:fumarylacetoacetate hydrolase family protein [Streptomyces silvisoli]|uniref:Fumarylacetoacetate hydrolase family protein n=1 Tax=Streptomyces silvisoli TaxID=3034235 RepID=A0ABT5ZLF0_9ACTN|nr:fumarylacetoacetate hydrolase family protein [Streptomyces silvisoli]MDF3290652.1 fumarylacetoacetate hydrolase family protein [Streptomyces silvisoli]